MTFPYFLNIFTKGSIGKPLLNFELDKREASKEVWYVIYSLGDLRDIPPVQLGTVQTNKTSHKINWFQRVIINILMLSRYRENASKKHLDITYCIVAQNSSNLLNFFGHTLVLHITICTPRYSFHRLYHSFCYHNPHCIRIYSTFHKNHQNNLPYDMLKTH